MPPHPLTNFEIQKHFQIGPRFNGVYSRDNIPNKIKDGAYMIKLDEYADVSTHLIPLYCKNDEIVYCNRFGDEHVPEETEKTFQHKNIKVNIFRVQLNNSMCGHFCIRFNHFIFAGKTLIDFTSLFSPYDFEKKRQYNIELFLKRVK